MSGAELRFYFLHRCGGCRWDGQLVVLQPVTEGSVYYLSTPRCAERGVELEQVREAS
jgi:hypothetical protein